VYGLGTGLKISYYFLDEEYFFNVINLEYTFLFWEFTSLPQDLMPGRSLEFNIGNGDKKEGLYWYWNIGIMQTKVQCNVAQIFPSFKVVINWNIIF
jgi:hypothetical protein